MVKFRRFLRFKRISNLRLTSGKGIKTRNSNRIHPKQTSKRIPITVNAVHAWTLGDVRFQYSGEWFVNELDWQAFATRLKDKNHVSNNRILIEDFAHKQLKMAEILIKIKIGGNCNALAFVERPYQSKTLKEIRQDIVSEVASKF